MKRSVIALSLLAAFCCGCEKSGADKPSGYVEEEDIPHGLIVLGEKLEDPYSIKNITKAIESLYPTKAGTVRVEPTHLYVRFRPSCEEDFDILDSLGVELLDHPVDFSIVREGDYYHDPELPEGEITWQYTVVPPGFEFPEGIEYEILDECHVAEQTPVVRSNDGIDWDAVEKEAFRLTGNQDLWPATRASSEKSRPKGRICIVDPRKGSEPIGVAGVTLSCNVFVKFSHAYTDSDGYYEIPAAYSSKPRYRILFKNRKGFGIGRNLIYVPASFSTLGKHGPEGVSITVTEKSDRALFRRCVVNNAAWDYYEQCKSEAGNICLPPSNLQIWTFDIMSCSSAVMLQQGSALDGLIKTYLGEFAPLVNIFLPDITLGLQDKEDYASIYSVTIHELAHASHYVQVGKDWWEKLQKNILTSFVTSGFVTYGVGTEEGHGYCEVAEMWAYYLESAIYNERYPGANVYTGTSYWFYPQIFTYLDNRGINRYKLFNVLLPAVCDRASLQTQLQQFYPEAGSMIRLAFSRYK